MKKALNWLWNYFDEALTFITFIGLFLVVLFQMTARSAFNFGFVWTEELSRLLLMYSCFASLPVVLKKREELKLTILIEKLSPRSKLVFDIAVQVISIITFAFLIYCGILTVQFQKTNIMPAMRFSMAYMYIAFPLSMLMGIVRSVQMIVEDIHQMKGVDTA